MSVRYKASTFSLLVMTCVVFLASGALADTNYTLKSPDDRIEVNIHIGAKISYDVALNSRPLMKDSGLAINMDGKTLGDSPQVKATKKNTVDRVLEPVVKLEAAKVREHYNELRLEMAGNYA